jgi:single-strand DNA-binding protein
MNVICIAGQLGKDAEVKYLPNGDAICNFSVADSQGRDKPTIWWNCGLYGKRAESLSKYLTKGQAVTVSGTVSEREWTDKEGNKRKTIDVRVSDLALQGGRKESASPAAKPVNQEEQQFDDSIPF